MALSFPSILQYAPVPRHAQPAHRKTKASLVDYLDSSGSITSAAIMLLCVAITLIVIAMDMRKLPLGRVKYMPWGFLTVVAVMCDVFAGHHLLVTL